MIVLVIIAMLAVSCSSMPPHEEIVSLRRMQQQSSYPLHSKLESQINEIKQKCDTHRTPSSPLLQGWYHGLPPFVWQLFVLLLWWYLCIRGMALWHRRHYLVLVVVLISFVVGSYAVAWYYDECNYHYALVCDEQSLLRVGPHNDYPCVDKVCYLDEVKIIERHGEWAHVSLRDKQGWLNVNNIIIL